MKKSLLIAPLLSLFIVPVSFSGGHQVVKVCISVPCDNPNMSCLPECEWVRVDVRAPASSNALSVKATSIAQPRERVVLEKK